MRKSGVKSFVVKYSRTTNKLCVDATISADQRMLPGGYGVSRIEHAVKSSGLFSGWISSRWVDADNVRYEVGININEDEIFFAIGAHEV